MSEPRHVTVVARLVIPVQTAPDSKEAERIALVTVRQSYPSLPWTVEHVETPWGT
jgi:hypothetical protein